MCMSLCKPSNDENMATLLLPRYISRYSISLCIFLCVSLVLMRKWPPSSSLVLSVLICPYVYSLLCESSSDEEVATLLLSSSVSMSYFICICMFLCVSLVVMSKWPPCSSIVHISVYTSISLWTSSSDERLATLLLSSVVHIYLSFAM